MPFEEATSLSYPNSFLDCNFQTSDYKERHFLNLNNDNKQPIHLIYSKGRAWLKYFDLSNLLCTHVTRLITNYTPIGKYRLRTFPNGLFAYLCGNSPIKIRTHILHKCIRYIKLWNSKQEFFKGVLIFLEFNLDVFCFQDNITH